MKNILSEEKKLVRQDETDFVITLGRWTFDWCTKDKQLFSWGIDTYLYWWLIRSAYIYIYMCVCVCVCMYLMKERERY